MVRINCNLVLRDVHNRSRDGFSILGLALQLHADLHFFKPFDVLFTEGLPQLGVVLSISIRR